MRVAGCFADDAARERGVEFANVESRKSIRKVEKSNQWRGGTPQAAPATQPGYRRSRIQATELRRADGRKARRRSGGWLKSLASRERVGVRANCLTWSGPTKKRRRPLRDPGASTVPPFARCRRLAVAPGPESHLPPSRCARSPEQPVHRPWWRRIALPVIRRPLRTLQPVDHQRPALRRLGPALAGRTHDRGDARPPDASPPPLRDGRRARPLPRIGEDQKWQEGRISTPRDNSHAPVILRADRADRTTVLAAFSRLGAEESHISQASESFYRMKKAAEKDDEVDGQFSLCVHWGAALRLAASLRDANPHTWMDACPAPIQARLACRLPDVADSRHHELEEGGLRISPADPINRAHPCRTLDVKVTTNREDRPMPIKYARFANNVTWSFGRGWGAARPPANCGSAAWTRH